MSDAATKINYAPSLVYDYDKQTAQEIREALAKLNNIIVDAKTRGL